MGTRSSNFVALSHKIINADEIIELFKGPRCEVLIQNDTGTLIVYESNFSPMWAMDSKGEHCADELFLEAKLHALLGKNLPLNFRMVRAGDEHGARGGAINLFNDVPEVMAINAQYSVDAFITAPDINNKSSYIIEANFIFNDNPTEDANSLAGSLQSLYDNGNVAGFFNIERSGKEVTIKFERNLNDDNDVISMSGVSNPNEGDRIKQLMHELKLSNSDCGCDNSFFISSILLALNIKHANLLARKKV